MKSSTKLILSLGVLAGVVLLGWQLLGRPKQPPGAPEEETRLAGERTDGTSPGPAAGVPNRGRRSAAVPGPKAADGAAHSSTPGRVRPGARVPRNPADTTGPRRAGSPTGTPSGPGTPREPGGTPAVPSAVVPRGDLSPGGPPAGDGTITGSVTLPSGELPAEVLLRLSPSGAAIDDEDRTREAHPDPGGQWLFEGLAPGRYRLVATHPRLAPHALSIELGEEAGSGPYEIALKRGGALAVRVLDAFDAPLPDEAIEVTSAGIRREGRTDADGLLRIEPLEAGEYKVRWKTSGSRGVVRYVTAIPGRDVEVLFKAGGALAGTVTGPDGEMLEGAIVRLSPADLEAEEYRAHEAKTDAEGTYRVTGIPEGEYRLTVQVLGRPAYTVEVGTQRIWAAQTEQRAIVIEPVTLTGQVTRSDDRSPLDRTRVQITATPLRAGASGTIERGRPLMAFADEEGRFSFVGIAPGRYELWFAPHVEALREQRLVVEVYPGGASEPVEIALETRRLGRLRLRVLEPDGSPATGLRFSRIKRTGSSISSSTLFAKDLGGGVFEVALEVGEQTVSVHRRGFRSQLVTVTVPDGAAVTREVRLEPRDD